MSCKVRGNSKNMLLWKEMYSGGDKDKVLLKLKLSNLAIGGHW